MSSSPDNRPGHDEVDPAAAVLVDGGASDAFGASDDGVDEDRVTLLTGPILAEGSRTLEGSDGLVAVHPTGSAAATPPAPDHAPVDDVPEEAAAAPAGDTPERPEVARAAAARPVPKSRKPAPRARATTTTTKATGRPARATRSKTDTKGSTAVKTTTRRPAEPAARKATKSPEIRAGAPSADALSGGLARLLSGVDEQVAAVTALSTRIDDLVTELNASRAEQAARWAALAQLREVAYDAGLGEVLDPRLAASLPSVEQDPYQPLG